MICFLNSDNCNISYYATALGYYKYWIPSPNKTRMVGSVIQPSVGFESIAKQTLNLCCLESSQNISACTEHTEAYRYKFKQKQSCLSQLNIFKWFFIGIAYWVSIFLSHFFVVIDCKRSPKLSIYKSCPCVSVYPEYMYIT